MSKMNFKNFISVIFSQVQKSIKIKLKLIGCIVLSEKDVSQGIVKHSKILTLHLADICISSKRRVCQQRSTSF